MRVMLVSGVCVCVCVYVWVGNTFTCRCVLVETKLQCLWYDNEGMCCASLVRGRRNYVRYGAVCERDGTVRWALGSGAEDRGQAEDSTTLEERGSIGVSDGIMCVILTFWHRVCDNCGPNTQTES